jgi:competence protein ComEC
VTESHSIDTPAAGAGFRSTPTAWALAFAAGVGGLFLLPRLPGSWLPAALLAGVGALAAAVGLWRRPWLPLALVVCFAVCGALWAYADACRVLCAPFPEELVGETLLAQGRIVSLPESRDHAERFLFRIERLDGDGGDVGFQGLARLSWYRDPPALLAGERWRLAVRLKPPHGFLNPGGFDYERWLFQQGIAVTGHVVEPARAALLDAGPDDQWLSRWRQRLRERLLKLVPQEPAAALLRALVLGDRGGLAPAQWEVFSRTGTSHLIAISGLHVGLVAGVVLLAVRWSWGLSPALARRVAAPRAAAAAALAAAACYAALAGFSVSTQRALAMLAVLLLATMLGRTLRPLSGLSLALLAVLVVDPASVLSYGFWLSFGAVAVLFYVLALRLAPPFAVVRWGQAQWAVGVGLLPLLLLFFGRASVVAPAVNLVLVPLFGLLLPAVLLSVVVALIGDWPLALWPMATVLDAGYGLLERVAALELAGVTLSGRPGWVWLAAVGGALLLLAPRGIPARWLGLVLLLPLAVVRPPAPRAGEAWVAMLDVGQGQSVVVRTAAHALVYDVGVRYPSGFDLGSAVVAPYLRHSAVAVLDTVVVSHADRDHAGGLEGMMAGVAARRILSGEPDELPGVDAEPCRAGDSWVWDGVAFRVLHPQAGSEQEGNDASCVLRVATAGASVLLTGDIEAGVESVLAAGTGADPADSPADGPSDGRGNGLRSDILLAAHHGSDSSSTAPFLRAVDPDWVWFSAGYANRFGFPRAAVLDRVRALGSATATTATDGAVIVRLPGSPETLRPLRWRRESARVWRHRPAADTP